MTNEAFGALLEARIADMRTTLAAKGKKYALGSDRLQAFKNAALITHLLPRQALLGMMAKQLVSVIDMIKADEEFPLTRWDEKIGDAINYLVLLEAIIKETPDRPREPQGVPSQMKSA